VHRRATAGPAGLGAGLKQGSALLSVLIGRRGEDAAQDPWSLDGAEAVLTLHAVISNGECWRLNLEREHQAPYPDIKQGKCTLGA
jgi:hypothetical protein